MQKRLRDLLKELNKTRDQYWNISPQVGQFINLLIRQQKSKKVLEIGTSNGYSALWIAEALSHHGGHLYTIESHFKQRFHLATQNFQKSGLACHITQILGHAPEAIPKTPRKFDFIFLDATKNEHAQYLRALLPRLAKNAIIVSDNILSHHDAMRDYLQSIKKIPQLKSTLLNIGTGLMISIKLSQRDLLSPKNLLQ